MDRFENGSLIQKNSGNTDTLVIIVLVWIIFSRLFFFVLFQMDSEFLNSDLFINVNILFSIIWGCIPLLLALSIKDATKKGIFLVFALIYLLVTIYEQVQGLFIAY